MNGKNSESGKLSHAYVGDQAHRVNIVADSGVHLQQIVMRNVI
jgi:hypothetical protein